MDLIKVGRGEWSVGFWTRAPDGEDDAAGVFDKLRVRGIERGVSVHGDPGDVLCIVAGAQGKVGKDGASVVVKDGDDGFHPGIVGIARIVDVAAIDDGWVGEQAVKTVLDGDAVLGGAVEGGEGFFAKFALEGGSDVFTGVDHAARNGPLTVVGALDGNKFEELDASCRIA